MCAIAGVFDLEVTNTILLQMLHTMQRRGPDDRGVYTNDSCALLHSRLAIMDPQGGAQPMELQWAGERYIIVYNGEIYNTQELRRELSALGHTFRGHSDTEIVLHSYAQWKEKALNKLNGIFAFAVLEEKTKYTLFGKGQDWGETTIHKET